ncbi:MAG TPA: Gfo/Idh/MocA family oxidoreductase [Candidatus Cybelea sp.]|nr:Gfo/Idh/MocA family oxidoreductase [Candidatus Cybelea sp.]
MAETLRVGLIGAGSMAGAHAAAWRGIDGVEIAGIASRTMRRAQGLAQAFGTRVSEIDAMLADPAIAAVDICAPTAAHRDLVIAALAGGKHVFCETPLAHEIADAEAMIAAARQAKRLLHVGLLMRSIVEYRHIFECVRSGEHGRLLAVMAYRLGSYLRPGAPDAKAHYGDPATELMTFDFDVLNWLLGPPASLSATGARLPDGRFGEISALLHYDSGASAVVTGSGIMPAKAPYTTGLAARFEDAAYELKTVFDTIPPKSAFVLYPRDGAPQALSLRGHNPYQAELQVFADCIRGRGDADLLDARHALAALMLSDATRSSLNLRQAISLPGSRAN